MMAKQSHADSNSSSLLLAAIQHLQIMYLDNPNRCLHQLITRNYGLLLNLNSSHQEHSKWQSQQKIWQQYYQQNKTRSNTTELYLV